LPLLEDPGDRGHVLVPSAGEVEKDYGTRPEDMSEFLEMGDRVGALEGRDDPFGLGKELKTPEGRLVVHCDVADPAAVLERAVLRADPGVVEPWGKGVGTLDLSPPVLEEVAHGPVEDPRGAADKGRRVMPCLKPFSRRLDAYEPHALVRDKGVEDTHGVAAAAHAGYDCIRKPSCPFEDLCPGLLPDDALEITDHEGIGMGATTDPMT